MRCGCEMRSLRCRFWRHDDLACACLRFQPRRKINSTTNCRKIATEARKLTDLDLAGVNTDTDTEAVTTIKAFEYRGAVLLYVERRHNRGGGMILSQDRKIEDRHQAIAHLLRYRREPRSPARIGHETG